MADSEAVAMLRQPLGLAVLDSPFHSVDHSSPSLDQRLHQLRVPKSSLDATVTVARGTRLYLSTDPSTPSILAPRLLQTPDLDEYKTWIGRANQTAANNTEAELSSAPDAWRGDLTRDLSQLSAQERADLETAGRIYLFGDSRRVSSYREPLEHLRGPFQAALFAARRVTVEAGASLVVSGDPAVLLFDELIVHPTGQLLTYTATHATFGRLEKLDAASDQPLFH